MTPAHRIKAVLSEDGKLSLDQLPFRAGQAVEVIVRPAPPNHALKGTVLRYDNPTAPVAETEWDTLEAGYQQMALDEAREAEALEWAEATVEDVPDEAP